MTKRMKIVIVTFTFGVSCPLQVHGCPLMIP